MFYHVISRDIDDVISWENYLLAHQLMAKTLLGDDFDESFDEEAAQEDWEHFLLVTLLSDTLAYSGDCTYRTLCMTCSPNS